MIDIKRIDRYLNKVYKRGNTKKIRDLKYEMKQHLLELVKELKNEGYSESEAIELALHRFGDKNSLKKDLTYFFKYPKRLFVLKILVLLGIILCLLALFTNDIGYGYDFKKYANLEEFSLNIEIPLKECDIDNIDDYINKHIRYLRVFEISDQSDRNLDLDTLQTLTSKKEIDSKKLKLIYSYGDFDTSSYLKAIVYNDDIPMWYIQYMTNDFEMNIKMLICIFLLIILTFVYIYICKNKKSATHDFTLFLDN